MFHAVLILVQILCCLGEIDNFKDCTSKKQSIIEIVKNTHLCTGAEAFSCKKERNLYKRSIDDSDEEWPRNPNPKNGVFPPIRNIANGDKPGVATANGAVMVTAPEAAKKLVMCNAVTIDVRIFMTASRCLVTLRVPHTYIRYRGKDLPAIAFVEPDSPTHQMFNDISVIVVDNTLENNVYNKMLLILDFSIPMKSSNILDKAILIEGFYNDKTKTKIEERFVTGMKMSSEICNTLLQTNSTSNDYLVPCIYDCTVEQYKDNKANCGKMYLHGLGNGVSIKIDRTYYRIGVTTWAPYAEGQILPLGVALITSDNFKENFKCAKRIRDISNGKVTKGQSYQGECDR